MASTQLPVNPRVFVGKPFIEIKKPPPISPTISASSISNATSTYPNGGHHVAPVSYELCTAYPSCYPLGCDGINQAPVQCDDCNTAAVAVNILGLCLLSLLIVITNVLVIIIITRTPSLQRRHGYIKVSLAASDLLVGVFVLPAAIYNMVTTLFLPPHHHSDEPEHLLNDFVQVNSVGSVLFGTILVISVTSSVYNLLLLSTDRFLAVFRPMQNRAGKYFSRRRLTICIGLMWFIGVLISSLPAMMPNKFQYVMDPTTFLFVQSSTSYGVAGEGVGPLAFFSLVVLGLPYCLIVVLNLTTLIVACKRLSVRSRLGSVAGDERKREKKELRMRAKTLRDTYPEMYTSETKSTILSGWEKVKDKTRTKSNGQQQKMKNYPKKEHMDRPSSALPHQKYRLKPKQVNARVTTMILTMIGAFTICILPYVVVNILLGTGDLQCGNVAVPYIISTYLVIISSAVNFFIYNLWHREFRFELVMRLRCLSRNERRTRRSSRGTSSSQSRPISGNSWPIVKQTKHPSPHYTSGVSSFQQKS